jgi:hypothetical protein
VVALGVLSIQQLTNDAPIFRARLSPDGEIKLEVERRP